MKRLIFICLAMAFAVNAAFTLDTNSSGSSVSSAAYTIRSNVIVGKISVVGDLNNITVILFDNLPDTIKLMHVYDKEKDRVVGTVMIKQRADTYLCHCVLVDGEISDIKRSQELYLNYNVSVSKKRVKFLDVGLSIPVTYSVQNNYFSTTTARPYFFLGTSFIAEFMESILVGFSISGGWNFVGSNSDWMFASQFKYLFGNPDDILSFYVMANMAAGIFNGSSGGTTPYFSAEPGFGIIIFRKFNFQIFVEAGYRLPIINTSIFNDVAGLNISIGANIFFTKG